MMAIVNDKPLPNQLGPSWRNFAAWGAVSAIVYVLLAWGSISLLSDDSIGDVLRSPKAARVLGLCLLFSIAVVGFTSWKRPVNLRTFGGFLIQNAVGIGGCVLVVWSFRALGRNGDIGASVWVAAGTGAALIVVACLGSLALASTHTRANIVDDEMAADDMRERGRLFLCSFAWMAVCGVLLIVLALAVPGGVLGREAALAAALVLVVIVAALTVAAWRLSDELARTLSHETGNMTYYLILVIGSGWSILAHLGFVAAPAPLDWVTMFTVLIFAASIIVLGRRKLLTR